VDWCEFAPQVSILEHCSSNPPGPQWLLRENINTMSQTILVTGASGQLGQRVLELILERPNGPRVIATTRTPEKLRRFSERGVDVRAADFEDEASVVKAARGAERALLISTDELDRPGHREAQQTRAARALAAAGVKHVVYTSIPKAERSKVIIAADHIATERAIAATGLDYTFLRDNLYTELLLGTLPGAIATGQLIDARGNGKTAYVTREDCARVAAAVLANPEYSGKQVFDVTGPAAISSEDLAKIVSEVSGRTVRHISVPLAAVHSALLQHGFPERRASVYASFDASIANHELEAVADTVERVTGRTPQSVKEFLLANRERLPA
jgi:NAD(P)H dehydrogenase (quinone)